MRHKDFNESNIASILIRVLIQIFLLFINLEHKIKKMFTNRSENAA